jgi:L-ascorbate metabolism protein UlaG (beta-lactamase superfamily)
MSHSVKWLGHAACQITTEKGKVILVDPWITGNPSCPIKKDDIKKADIILVTHAHFDHIGTDIPEIVNATGATFLGQPEMISKLVESGLKQESAIGMNIGGQVEVKGIKVRMTQAVHSSEAGEPAGFIITLEDGKTVYHAGDTGIFAGMELIGKLYDIDIALLPIGSVFVMDPSQAAHSLTLLKPKKVIPIHYQTFPILVQDADDFVKLAKEKAPETKVEAIKPGQEVSV